MSAGIVGGVVKRQLEPIKEDLQYIKKQVDAIRDRVDGLSIKIAEMEESLKAIKVK